MRNYFKFGEHDSRDFGVYISGEGTYNAPARVYDSISVPGRNGDLLIDKGNFGNISLIYPAFIAGKCFKENLAAFRSAMLSTVGYARLTDTYHPDEFRLAYFGDAITVKARDRNDAGNFDIIFNCKPQRFLLSGEEPVTYPPGAVSKNILPFPYYRGSATIQGITYTVNDDGTVTVNGTATDFSNFVLRGYSTTPSIPWVSGENYILSGCPKGGSLNTYRLRLDLADFLYDYGNGVPFTYPGNLPGYLDIAISSGVTVNNLVFKPMIRKASDPDGWEPYYDGAQQIYNPTLFASKPLIRVTGSGTVGIGDETITIASGYDYVDIDSEIQNCYCGNQNANAAVTFSNRKFPELQPGLNGVTFGTGIESVQITPRWFRL